MTNTHKAHVLELVGRLATVTLAYPTESEDALRSGWDRVRRGSPPRRIVIDQAQAGPHHG